MGTLAAPITETPLTVTNRCHTVAPTHPTLYSELYEDHLIEASQELPAVLQRKATHPSPGNCESPSRDVTCPHHVGSRGPTWTCLGAGVAGRGLAGTPGMRGAWWRVGSTR